MNAPIPRRWISVSEAAAYLSISTSGARKMITRGEIAAVRLGRALRIDLRQLEAGLERQMQSPGAK